MSLQQNWSALVGSHGQGFGVAGEQILCLVAFLERNAEVIECMGRNLYRRSSRFVIEVHHDEEEFLACLAVECILLVFVEYDSFQVGISQVEEFTFADGLFLVAQVQEGNLAAAKKSLEGDKSAKADYLRAVIAVKEGNLTEARAALSSVPSFFITCFLDSILLLLIFISFV